MSQFSTQNLKLQGFITPKVTPDVSVCVIQVTFLRVLHHFLRNSNSTTNVLTVLVLSSDSSSICNLVICQQKTLFPSLTLEIILLDLCTLARSYEL